MEKHSKIFVAGHRGLLGSGIARSLTASGYTNILTVDRQSLDLTDTMAVERWFRIHKPEYVFLAAAKVGGIAYNLEASGDFIRENLQIQMNVINSAYLNDCAKLLFPGSNCVYPKFPKLPITEDQLLTGALEPSNEAYAVAKIAGIKLCQHLYKQHNFKAISVMPCNLYGPNDSFSPQKSHVMAAMISKFVTAQDQNLPAVTLWGDGSALREFLYADDVADACVLCMEKYDDMSPINLGSGTEIALKKLAKKVKAAVGYSGDIIWDTTKPVGTLSKVLDITKLTQLGWKPKWDLDSGIPAAVEYFRKISKN